MWVRSLSPPPPHPLVLTGKGRSFLQPKLPTLPLRPFPLSVCALCFPCYQKVGVFAAFTTDFCGGSCCIFVCFLVLCCFLGGDGTPLSFISCKVIIYWFTVLFFFLQSSAWRCASVTLVMCILVAPTLQQTLKQVLFLHSFCMNFPLI